MEAVFGGGFFREFLVYVNGQLFIITQRIVFINLNSLYIFTRKANLVRFEEYPVIVVRIMGHAMLLIRKNTKH